MLSIFLLSESIACLFLFNILFTLSWNECFLSIRFNVFFYIFVTTLIYALFYTLENRGEFLEKLQRARTAVRQGTSSPILSSPGPLRIVVGNWVLNSQKENHLHINNSEGHQVMKTFFVAYELLLSVHLPYECKSITVIFCLTRLLGHNIAR